MFPLGTVLYCVVDRHRFPRIILPPQISSSLLLLSPSSHPSLLSLSPLFRFLSLYFHHSSSSSLPPFFLSLLFFFFFLGTPLIFYSARSFLRSRNIIILVHLLIRILSITAQAWKDSKLQIDSSFYDLQFVKFRRRMIRQEDNQVGKNFLPTRGDVVSGKNIRSFSSLSGEAIYSLRVPLFFLSPRHARPYLTLIPQQPPPVDDSSRIIPLFHASLTLRKS